MALDQTANFVNVEITGTYTSSDTTIQLASGDASELPDTANGEYNLVWYDNANYLTPDSDPEVEIVRVTGVDTSNDTVTVTRGQEGTSAVAHDTSDAEYRFILAPTSKMFADIDAGNFTNNSFTLAGNTIALGDSTNIEVDNFAGNNGSSGQFLQTDGTNLSFSEVSTGTVLQIRSLQNDQQAAIARLQFENNLSELGYDGGLFAIWRDTSKIASKTDVNVQTLEGGDAKGLVELGTNLIDNWMLSSASYSGTSISTQDGTPTGIFWKDDGTKFWEIGNGSGLIYEYNVSTAWDLSTASYSGTSISTQDSNPTGIFWKNDGTKFWEIGNGSDLIYEYNVSTAWDLSTASYSGTSISTQDGISTGIFWKNDGTKFWEIGLGSELIYEYNVSTAWDLSTASYSGTSISTQDGIPTGIFWKDDGTKFWEIGRGSGLIYEYNVSTAWDLSTASYSGTSISTQDGNSSGIFWKNDGTKFWEIGNGSDLIYEYDVGSEELASSGSVTLISKDLSNDGFTNPPTSVVLSQAATIDTDEDIQYTVRDGDSNTVTVTQSDVDTEVDTSNFTSTVVEVDLNLSQSGGTTPTSDDVMVHFQE